MSILVKTKKCLKCGIEQPLTEFYKSSRNKDGKSIYCITCSKEKNKINYIKRQDKNIAYAKQVGLEHRRYNLSYPPSSDGTKICCKCHIEKSVLEFNINRSISDGRSIYCRVCQTEKCREQHIKRHDKDIAYGRSHYRENVIKYKEYNLTHPVNFDGTKICSGCKIEKPKTEFQRNICFKDGLTNYCKSCQKEYSKTEKGKLRIKRQYERRKHSTRRIEWRKAFRKTEKGKQIDFRYSQTEGARIIRRRLSLKYSRSERGKQLSRQRYQQRSEDQKQRKLQYEYRYRHSDQGRQVWYRYTHTENYKIKVTLLAHKRRAQLLAAKEDITVQQWMDLCNKYENKCLCCKKQNIPLAKDHIVPLSRMGSHTIDNLQPLCKSCNSRKGIKTIDYRPDSPNYIGSSLLT